MKHTSLKSTRFLQKKIRLDTFLTDYVLTISAILAGAHSYCHHLNVREEIVFSPFSPIIHFLKTMIILLFWVGFPIAMLRGSVEV